MLPKLHSFCLSSLMDEHHPLKHQAPALIFPHPTQSHIVPALILTKNLAATGLPVTLVLTEFDKHHTGAQLANHPGIRCLGVPDGLGPDERRTVMNPKFMQAFDNLQGEVENLIQTLVSQDGSPPCCIISDIFVYWMGEVALKFNIPRVLFWTGGASSFSIFFHIPLLLSGGIIPIKGKSHPNEPDPTIDFVPGLPPLRLPDLPHVIKVEDTSDQFFQFIFRSYQKIGDSPCVLVHTFEELERGVLDALLPIATVHPIGPLLSFNFFDKTSDDDDKCFQWLHKHPVSSVLYIAFGTLHSPSIPLMQALATGLEASQQPFLWVIRHDAIGGAPPSEILPEGFLLRVKERGLIVAWAPQMRVLSHPSVGGFLTHCGWNSTMESIYAGVPMIVWPQKAEQALNARFIVEEWKVGVRLRGGGDGSVTSGDVEGAVKRLMRGDEASDKSMRERAKKLGEASMRAVMEGGSSYQSLRTFVNGMRKKD